MKIALVHDYLNEFGGAEKVLQTLSDMWPEAPIYTAFCVPGSSACEAFKDKKVITSWLQNIPGYGRLYSPLRFLIPWIWGSFDLSDYDLVITSASWYITKGIKKNQGGKEGLEICYCHTPPRWLYGYPTSVNWQKYWPVRIYAAIVGHFLRMYDFTQAQKVDVFVANSKEVQARIKKFYRREAQVIYPPVQIPSLKSQIPTEDYYLMVTRVVGGKGIELAVEAANKYGFKLKIAGEQSGFKTYDLGSKNVEYLGRVSEEEKYKLMSGAKAFFALATNEDFGITPVESMMCGTPVIAYNGGGYKETVVDGKTGVLFDELTPEGLNNSIGRLSHIRLNKTYITNHAKKFSVERFKSEIMALVAKTSSLSV